MIGTAAVQRQFASAKSRTTVLTEMQLLNEARFPIWLVIPRMCSCFRFSVKLLLTDSVQSHTVEIEVVIHSSAPCQSDSIASEVVHAGVKKGMLPQVMSGTSSCIQRLLPWASATVVAAQMACSKARHLLQAIGEAGPVEFCVVLERPVQLGAAVSD